ncbi:hypothetical protein [Actinospica robiniae]|uniref:hypothetical protein n=1 Tax=Actinospica robiniae TaxID=304901 RepID=UPI00055513D7|nr:hypothetical protein [Actinospica robiniae]
MQKAICPERLGEDGIRVEDLVAVVRGEEEGNSVEVQQERLDQLHRLLGPDPRSVIVGEFWAISGVRHDTQSARRFRQTLATSQTFGGLDHTVEAGDDEILSAILSALGLR